MLLAIYRQDLQLRVHDMLKMKMSEPPWTVEHASEHEIIVDLAFL